MPGVSVAGDELLRAVAATGLPGTGTDAALPAAPLEHYAWDRVIAGVRVQRLQGLLAAAVDEGRLPVSAAQRDEVAEAHAHAMAVVERCERGMLAAVAALRAAGVEPVLLKGSAVAHLDYADPSQRIFGDVDVLIHPDAFDDALEVLVAAGYRTQPDEAGGFGRRFAESVALADPDGARIDLHRSLVRPPFGLLVEAGTLFEDVERFTVSDTELRALSTTCRFLQACYSAVLGNQPVRLVPLRDAAGIALSGRLDRDAAIGLAERWQGGAVVARAVGLAWRAFRLDADDPLARWAVDRRESNAERALLAPFGAESRRHVKGTLAGLRLLSGPRTKAAYLMDVLVAGRRRQRRRRRRMLEEQAPMRPARGS